VSTDRFGDFQTPPALVAAVLDCLRSVGGPWRRILEPTCGQGNFLLGVLERWAGPLELQAVELQAHHCDAARRRLGPLATVHSADLFALDLARDLHWQSDGPLLVLGNPPWVTSAALGRLGAATPQKDNPHRLRGLAAVTGSANFDFAEAVVLKILRELADQTPTVAMLCKFSVVRSVLAYCAREGIAVEGARVWPIDARQYFKASVAACLFYLPVGQGRVRREIPLLIHDGPGAGERVQWIAEPSAIASGRGWRQGIKHDAAALMELIPVAGGGFANRRGESVAVEESHLYPLLKASDLFHGRPPTRRVLLTQRRLGDDTRQLATDAPRLWAYLNRHADAFAARRSSVYANRPPFAMFGVGDYAFTPYKVCVSGLHPEPRFRVVTPHDDQPTLLDDTSYYLPCATFTAAEHLASALNSPAVQAQIHSLRIPGAKRPITKRLLEQLAFPEPEVESLSGNSHPQ